MTTEVMWSKRVSAWRESGQTAETYSDGRGFAAATLRWWSSRLGRTPRAVPLARVLARPSGGVSAARAIVVEVADAKLHVPSGTTRGDLVAVLDALEARTRAGAR